MSEYLIVVMLVAVAAITATTAVGETVISKLKQIKTSISQTVELSGPRGEKKTKASEAVGEVIGDAISDQVGKIFNK